MSDIAPSNVADNSQASAPRRNRRHGTDHSAARIPTAPSTAKSFSFIVRGVLEGAECHEHSDALFARTYWVYGPDWEPVPTLTPCSALAADLTPVRPLDRCTASEVVTQLSSPSLDIFSRFTWAAPFECVLRSTNPHGWPQLIVSLHTVTGAVAPKGEEAQANSSSGGGGGGGGGERCLAYSRCFMPMREGTYRKRLPLLQLLPSTRKQSWITWWMGEQPELRDPSLLCSGEDRVVLSARPMQGHVSISLNVTISGFAECGFEP